MGLGVEGDLYRLKKPAFYPCDIYDVDAGWFLRKSERLELALTLDIFHVPIVDAGFWLTPEVTMDQGVAPDILEVVSHR